jgi:hypothetical protein
MKYIKKFFFFIIAFSGFTIYGQQYKKWDDESVDEFYEKVSVKNGTLSEDGSKISFVLVPSIPKQGIYEVKITDYKNDLYEIKGTGYYVKFRGYHGYAGYGEEGVLEVGSSAWSSTYYEKP